MCCLSLELMPMSRAAFRSKILGKMATRPTERLRTCDNAASMGSRGVSRSKSLDGGVLAQQSHNLQILRAQGQETNAIRCNCKLSQLLLRTSHKVIFPALTSPNFPKVTAPREQRTRGQSQIMSVARGERSQILTKGRRVEQIWYGQWRGGQKS